MSHAPTFPANRVAPSLERPATAPRETERERTIETNVERNVERNLVHESESQRQHVRVRVPGQVEFELNNARVRAKLFDVSAGGLSFQLPDQHGLKVGQALRGTLTIHNEPIGFTLPVNFQVRNFIAAEHRVGVRFQDMGPREIGALRALVSSVLTGDAITVGDAMRAAGNRTARPRGNAGAPPATKDSSASRFRALAVSVFALTLGVTAFGYALKQAHHLLFVTSANAAKVAGQVYTVAMPREGMFYSLIPADNIVKKGAAIASFEASVLDLVRGQAIGASITADQLTKLSTQSVKGTITSPCDCRVQVQFVANAQYAGRAQPLFELTPVEVKDPQIMARFRYDQADKIAPGTKVRFHITGDFAGHSGTIKQLRVPNETDTVGGDVIAMIEPDVALPPDMVNRPVSVDVGGFVQFNPFAVASSMAAGKGDHP